MPYTENRDNDIWGCDVGEKKWKKLENGLGQIKLGEIKYD